MNESSMHPRRPVLLFDGGCGFCGRAVRRALDVVGDRVDFVPYQEFAFEPARPDLSAEACEDAVHLIETDGRVTRAAEACFRTLAHAPGKRWVRGVYRLPLVAPVTEALYRRIAANRSRISGWLRLGSGPDGTPARYGIGRRVFLILLGLALVAAFASFGVQALGLIGSQGVLPLERMIAWDAHVMPYALLEMPTLFWFAQGDLALLAVHAVGILAALLLVLGVAPRLTLATALCAWLSLAALAFPPAGPDYVGNVFLGYQWDGLLVEAGFLGLFVAPRGLRGRFREPPGAAGVFLLRLLLFRVVLGDVLVRVTGGDPGFAADGADALRLWTQPLPTWIAVVVQGLSPALLAFARHVDEVVGFALVFGLFGPRRLRAVASFAIVAVTLVGALVMTSGVWPVLVIALVALAIDDVTWRRLLPRPVSARIRALEFRAVGAWTQWGRGVLACALAALALHVSVQFFGNRPTSAVQAAMMPYQVCNAYGRFAVVERERFALTIEGSDDGVEWIPYPTVAAPGDPFRAPPWPSPHIARLDWKLDAAARQILRGEEPPVWFVLMLQRLLDPMSRVATLFAPNRFDSAPPRALRILVHRLEPASPADREKDGMWWYRRPGSVIGTPVMLDADGKLVPARF